MIVPTQRGCRSLSRSAFQACLPAYALKRAHIRAIDLRCAKISQPDILFANLATLFCTQFKVLTWPSLYGSQHTAAYWSAGLTSAVYCRCYMWFWMQMLTDSQQNITFVVCVWDVLILRVIGYWNYGCVKDQWFPKCAVWISRDLKPVPRVSMDTFLKWVLWITYSF